MHSRVIKTSQRFLALMISKPAPGGGLTLQDLCDLLRSLEFLSVNESSGESARVSNETFMLFAIDVYKKSETNMTAGVPKRDQKVRKVENNAYF